MGKNNLPRQGARSFDTAGPELGAGARLKAAWAERSAGMAGSSMTELSKAKALAHYCAQGAWAMAAQAVGQGARSDLKESSVSSEFLGLSRKCLPIQMAAFAGESELLRAMLDSGADPEASDGGDPCRPLAMALWGGHWSCVQMLIEAGASVKRLCSLPARPAPMAYAPLLVAVLSACWRGAERHAEASRPESDEGEGRARCVRLLAAAGADLNETSAAGETALTAAARVDAAELIEELCALGADVSRADKNKSAPAGMALRHHSARALGALIDAGARLSEDEMRSLKNMPYIARSSAASSYWDDDGRSENEALVWEGCLARMERREISLASLAGAASNSARTRRI